MVLSDLIELMVRGRGRGWKCQIRRAEQRDQCAVTVYTQETRICSAEPPKKKHCQAWCSTFGEESRSRGRGCDWLKSKDLKKPEVVQRSAWFTEQYFSSLWLCLYRWQWPWRNVQSEMTAGRVSSTLSCMMKERRTGWDEGELWERPGAWTPVKERYMSLQVGGSVGGLEVASVENLLMQSAVENSTHSPTWWKFSLWGSRSAAHGCRRPYCLVLQIEQN